MNSPAQRRSPWPYALIGFFAVLISCIISVIAFASTQKIDLVSKDYYEQEIQFQRQIDQKSRANKITTEAAVDYDTALNALKISIPNEQAVSNPSGRIYFYRPSDASMDREVKLAVDSNGGQRVNLDGFRAGPWKVKVFWKVGSDEFLRETSIIIPRTQAAKL